MAFNSECQIAAVHAATIVYHTNELASAVFDSDVNAMRTGVQRIFDQFLDCGARPLDHFASGDTVDENGVRRRTGMMISQMLRRDYIGEAQRLEVENEYFLLSALSMATPK